MPLDNRARFLPMVLIGTGLEVITSQSFNSQKLLRRLPSLDGEMRQDFLHALIAAMLKELSRRLLLPLHAFRNGECISMRCTILAASTLPGRPPICSTPTATLEFLGWPSHGPAALGANPIQNR